MVRGTLTAVLALAGGLAIGCSAVPAQNAAAEQSRFERQFLDAPGVRDAMVADGSNAARKVGDDGALPGAINGSKGAGVAVEVQRRAYSMIAAGILSSGSARAELIDDGLRALEWGFAQAGATGSFPNEHGGDTKRASSLHSKAQLLEAAGRSLRLIRQSGPDSATSRRADAVAVQLHRSATWMAKSSDLQDFWRSAANTNQRLVIALALHESGILSGDAALTAQARNMVEDVIRAQTADGVFVEKGGFDTNYQLYSLELLARYVTSIPSDPWQKRVLVAIDRGTSRLLAAITPDGRIRTDQNTRTVACGDAKPGKTPKDKRVNATPLGLRYIGLATGKQAKLGPLADNVQNIGLTFKHRDKCR